MVATTNRRNHEATREREARDPQGELKAPNAARLTGADAAELTAARAADQVGALFPVVYRRYHTGGLLRHGAELPVTRRALQVLQHLKASGPLTVGEQAAHLGLRRNSMSELLQRLERKGLVSRIRDERDERRVLVWLTDAGHDVVRRIGQILAPDALTGVLGELTAEERAAVVRGFALLAHAPPPRVSGFPQTRNRTSD